MFRGEHINFLARLTLEQPTVCPSAIWMSTRAQSLCLCAVFSPSSPCLSWSIIFRRLCTVEVLDADLLQIRFPDHLESHEHLESPLRTSPAAARGPRIDPRFRTSGRLPSYSLKKMSNIPRSTRGLRPTSGPSRLSIFLTRQQRDATQQMALATQSF